MNILIDESAKKYLLSKNIHSICVLFPGCGKCNSPTRQASVGLAVPGDLSRYECYQCGEFSVYVRDDVRKHKASLTISLTKYFWLKEPVAD